MILMLWQYLRPIRYSLRMDHDSIKRISNCLTAPENLLVGVFCFQDLSLALWNKPIERMKQQRHCRDCARSARKIVRRAGICYMQHKEQTWTGWGSVLRAHIRLPDICVEMTAGQPDKCPLKKGKTNFCTPYPTIPHKIRSWLPTVKESKVEQTDDARFRKVTS